MFGQGGSIGISKQRLNRNLPLLIFSLASTMTHIPAKSQTIQASSRMIKFQVLAVELWVKVA